MDRDLQSFFFIPFSDTRMSSKDQNTHFPHFLPMELIEEILANLESRSRVNLVVALKDKDFIRRCKRFWKCMSLADFKDVRRPYSKLYELLSQLGPNVNQFNADNHGFLLGRNSLQAGQILSYFTGLQVLDLAKSENIRDLSFLIQMPLLEHLSIDSCCNIESIEEIRSCSRLKLLEMPNIHLSPAQIRSVCCSLQDLIYLNVDLSAWLAPSVIQSMLLELSKLRVFIFSCEFVQQDEKYWKSLSAVPNRDIFFRGPNFTREFPDSDSYGEITMRELVMIISAKHIVLLDN